MKNQDLAYEKAKIEVAEEIVKAELATIEKAEETKLVASQQEREKLVAGAYRLAGRIEGVSVMSKFADVSNLLLLKQAKENKVYRDMPGIGTWENFCNYIGFSRSKVDENLQNLERFGEEFLTTVGTFGIGYRELRKLRTATADGTLSINDKTITIEVIDDGNASQEVISLDDKDELKDALERIIAAKDIKIKSMRQMQEFSEKRYADTEKSLRKATKELQEITKNGEVDGITLDDLPHFKNMATVAETLTSVYTHLKNISNENLSDSNTLYLHGTIMYMVQLAGELSYLVPSYGELNVTDADLKAADTLPIPGIRNIKGHQ